MEFHPEANQVEYVICPARIDDKVADKARVALGVSEVQPGITVEMFQTDDDEILINEVAPRHTILDIIPEGQLHFSI
jgi:5-(carboxyamino)imidazole ribonucleotide synthase